MDNDNFMFPYINYKGDFAIREVIPTKVSYQYNNKYHGSGWLLTGVCKEKQEFRAFNLTDILRGTIIHTLNEMHVTVTPERVDGIMNNMNKRGD